MSSRKVAINGVTATEDSMSEADAEATLRAITSWSRDAELFAYDDKTGRFTLDNPA